MTHNIKSTPEDYLKALTKEKPFILTKDDQSHKVGDWLCLEEFKNGEYTGMSVMRKITYALRDCEKYGLMDGFVILGLR